MFAGAWSSQLTAVQYVEPAVNRQPGFRQKLVEQNQQRHRIINIPSWGWIQFVISKCESISEKIEKFKSILKIFIFILFSIFEYLIFYERQSTSPPCGNLVDGLPRDRHTETQSIRRTRHPRTSVNFAIEFVFLVKFYIMSYWFALLTLKISY